MLGCFYKQYCVQAYIHLVHMSIKGESNKNSIKSFDEDCDQKYFQKLALSNVLANHESTNKENLLQKTRYRLSHIDSVSLVLLSSSVSGASLS